MTSADLDQLLDRHRDKFRQIVRAIVAEEAGPDPFTFSLATFRALGDDDRFDLVRRAGVIARDRVDRELASRGAAWIVIVGDEVVAESRDIGSCPEPAAVLAMGEPTDRVAYLFEGPVVEEVPARSSWAPLARDDAYPTIPLAIGGEVLDADLDTGSPITFVDGRRLTTTATTWFEGRHLGQTFHWTPGRARFAVAGLERDVPTRFVRDWAKSPFVRINPARSVLAGRDLLRALRLRLRLEGPDKETVIDDPR